MIEIQNLSGSLGEFCLRNIDLTVQDGEYMVLLGPTGAGKTVLIEYMVGMYRQREGVILVDGEDITPLYTEERNIAYVPQDYALFPNLSVAGNIAYGLEAKRHPKKEITRITEEILDALGIGHLRHRMPLNLSGGEKQRVALGRALATRPKVVLLDEPLSALDENLRAQMSRELRDLQQSSKATFVHVCHNFEEASAVADRIAIMNNGFLVQVGTLEEVKAQPKNEFVARFLKTQNIFPAVADGTKVLVNGIQLEKKSSTRGDMVMAIRPEKLRIHPDNEAGGLNAFRGTIVEAIPRPHFIEYTVDVGLKLTVFQIAEREYRVGDAVTVQVPAEHIALVEKV
ncbi:MAG: ABC transporter ATP-binding protein [Desulfuromonadaceae bacterium]|nr:ABC transporter ATP-binding protein [Desulfuromonadaceae bacterium]